MSAILRPLVYADEASLAGVIDAVCGEGRWMRTRCFEPTPAWQHAFDLPGCPDHLLLVVLDAQRVVGWCRLFPATCPIRGIPLDLDLGIGLLPRYRDRGLGTRLVRQALSWAGQRGAPGVTLTTRADNARALRLFIKCGFRHIGRVADGSLAMERRPLSWGGQR